MARVELVGLAHVEEHRAATHRVVGVERVELTVHGRSSCETSARSSMLQAYRPPRPRLRSRWPTCEVHVRTITADDLLRKLDDGTGVFVLDVREPDEFADGDPDAR